MYGLSTRSVNRTTNDMLILVERERWQRAFVSLNDTPLDTCIIYCCNIYLSGASKPQTTHNRKIHF
jgi:hypothetical protein